MKNNEYFIVHKSLLPDYFDQIIKVRDLVNHKQMSISDACKQHNISRATYYKYKDYIFRPAKDSGNKVIYEVKTIDEKGILSSILNVISNANGNIISINQDSPIDGNAHITVSIDACDLVISVEELKNKIDEINGVKSIDIMGVE